jgi:hypothetical protein
LGAHVKNCTSTGVCKICQDPNHNTLLHHEKKPTIDKDQHSPSTSDAANKTTNCNASIQLHCNQSSTPKVKQQVLLSTAIVLIVDSTGQWHQARVLLDSASQSCFITERFLQSIKLKRYNAQIPISGINQLQTNIKYKTTTRIKSRFNSYEEEVELLVISNITGMVPSSTINITDWDVPEHIDLADPRFFEPNQIDILLGANHFCEILKSGKVLLGQNKPWLIETQLGWIVAGSYETQVQNIQYVHVCSDDQLITSNLHKELFNEEKSNKNLTDDVIMCEQHFQQTSFRDLDGRYALSKQITLAIFALVT